MIEIWTEDSGAGYLMTKMIMHEMYGKDFVKVVPHAGNGDNAKGKNGCGMLDDLKRNRHNPSIIVLIADFAKDNSDVALALLELHEELKNNHSKYHRLTGLYCFEYGILTYKELGLYGGMDRASVRDDVNAYIKAIQSDRFSMKIAKDGKSEYFKDFSDTDSRSGEKIGKALLSLATSKANIKVGGKLVHGAAIKSSSVGCCWSCDCCIYSNALTSCDSNIRDKLATHKRKIEHLVKNSKFKVYIDKIDSTISKKIEELFIKDSSIKYWEKNSTIALKYLHDRKHAIKFLDFTMQKGYWTVGILLDYIRRDMAYD